MASEKGNVWRFPYLCYKNGGGVFLIPYFTCMFVLAMPMVYLEFVVGQFTSSGCLTAYNLVKVTKGIGIGMNVANAFLTLFFNSVIAYAFYFFITSFTTELPWNKCNQEWSSPNCVDDFSLDKFTSNKCLNKSFLFKCAEKKSLNYGRCFNKMALDGSLATCSMNQSQLEQVGFWKTSFPSADYWRNIVLEKSESIEYSGEIVWHLVLSLFAIHLIVYFLLIKGIKVSGKAVYFTALFPYFVLVILGIRGWFLPGAEIGIKFYLTPKWKKLMDIRVWIDGATTVFFSLGISYGGMSTLASYNKFDADIMRAAILVPLVNCLTSFFAGFVIFAYMGYLCQLTGQGIDDIIEAGQGLAFVVYPYAVTTLVGAPIWSVLFFFMLCLLGISSQVANIQVTITSILDGLPILQATNKRKYLTITAIFFIYFLISLIFTFQSGTYWVEVFNAYSGDWGILVIGAAECIIVSYLYGLKNFRNDIEVMLGSKYAKGIMFNIWVILWAFISPAFCLIVAIIAFTKLKNINIGDNVFPDWTLYLGQTIQIGVIFGLFGGAVYFIVFDSLINKKKTLVDLFKPNFDEYIPKNECDRIRVKIKRGLEIGEINENFISKIKLVQEE